MPKLSLPLFAATLLSASTAVAAAQKMPIRMTTDLTEGPHHIFHTEYDLPVKPGALTLITPQWIPGEHAPNGSTAQLVGIQFTANGKILPWRRDDVNLYEFHMEVPAGTSTLHAHIDSIAPARVSPKMVCLEWQHVLLYPAHIPIREIAVEPSITTPAGWGIGTALTSTGTGAPPVTTGYNEEFHQPAAGSVTTHFAVTNVEQLADSPVITGAHFKEFALAPEVTPKHFIDVAADNAGDENLRPELLAEISNLVREAGTAYASHHYNAYHFLLTLSDVAGGEGLEHGQSSDNGVEEKGFADPIHQLGNSDLLAHEFTHSWNGKYRRPALLQQPDFATPQQGQLLWVYEGMTQYMGNVLAARSGLKNQEQYRDLLALSAASLDNEPGRVWRSTEDTAIASSIARHPVAYADWERGQAYYQEGELMWLDADTLIRQKTNGAKSLTDFQKIFLGKNGNTGPDVVTYDRKELIRDLNQVMPYDWATFLHERIDVPSPHANFAGIERGGYKVVMQEKPNASQRALTAASSRRGGGSFWYSTGLRVGPDGTVQAARYGSPADKAHLTYGQKILAVNGEVFSSDNMRQAILEAKSNTAPIHLIVQDGEAVMNVDLDYHDGEKYPALVRIEGTPALLDDITKPLTTPVPAPASSAPTAQ